MKPEIRFREFEGKWKEEKAGNIFKTFNEKNRPDLPVLSATQDKGMVPRDVIGYNIFHDKSNEATYKHILPGQFVIHLRSFQGGFAHSSVEGITSPAYTILDFKNKEENHDYFWKYIFSSKEFVRRLELITYGIRDGRSINFDEFAEMPFLTPSKEEQQKIAGYFNPLDRQITLQTRRLASLKQIKAASLQSMFPQEGETTPRIRFKGFEGKWEKAKLSSIAKRITRKNKNLETTLPVTISAADGIVEQTSFFNNVVASSNLCGYYLIEKGEFAYNKSYSNGYPYGAVKRMNKYDKGALSTLYIVFKIDETNSSDYLLYFFETTLWHSEIVKRASEGARNHGLLNISAEDFLDIDIMIPLNISEQQKIANYFKTLDRQITLQTRRLEKLKQIKTACLNKMFV